MSVRIGNYIIEADTYGVIVYKERKKKVKGKPQEESEEDIVGLVGYFSSLATASSRILDCMGQDGVAESKSLKAILDTLEQGKQEMRELFKGMKCPVS